MSYLENPSLANLTNSQDLLKDFMGRIQRARYETFIINLASAYEGYRFYLPTFLDFRARIYRAGVLHFHERDLARSLIVFSDSPYQNSQLDSDKEEYIHMVLTSAAAFHYKKFIFCETKPAFHPAFPCLRLFFISPVMNRPGWSHGLPSSASYPPCSLSKIGLKVPNQAFFCCFFFSFG